jgi:hypothetical protein
MIGKRAGSHALARCQAWLMRPFFYVGSVWGGARDPLEWLLFDTPDFPCQAPPRSALGSVPRGSTGGRSLQGLRTCLFRLTNRPH